MKTLEVILLLSVMVHLILFSWGPARPTPTPAPKPAAYVNPALIEAEVLAVPGRSGDIEMFTQSTEDFVSGRWSRDGHLFLRTRKAGDWVDFLLPVETAGRYRVIAYLTRSYDYGNVEFSINGRATGEKISLWSPDGQVFPTGPLSLGTFELTPEKNRLRVTVVGSDPASAPPHYQFAIDGIKLIPVSQ